MYLWFIHIYLKYHIYILMYKYIYSEHIKNVSIMRNMKLIVVNYKLCILEMFKYTFIKIKQFLKYTKYLQF